MKQSVLNRVVACLLVLVLVFSLAPMSNEVSAAAYTGIMHQTDAVYKTYWYGNATLYDLGCGIFAFANAVGYLTGYQLDVIEVANWAYSQGVFDDVYGVWGDYFYHMASERYGPTYGFTIDSDYDDRGYYGSIYDARIKNHLISGGTVVVHVDEHFMALVGYDPGSGLYHVYDSGPCAPRNTLSGNGDVWLTAAQLNSGYTNVDWYHLVSPVVKDTEKPVISNIKISDRSSSGYTVSCTVTDNAGVQKVAFPTWTLLNGQDDLPADYINTQLGTRNGNTYTFRVNRSAHYQEFGYYVTHIYAVDVNGNIATASTGNIEIRNDQQKPVISNVEYTQVSAKGYTLSCTVTDDWEVVSVSFPTWTTQNGQDDLKWYAQKVEDGVSRYTVRIDASAHNNETGQYVTHIYAKDRGGNEATLALPAVMVMDDTEKPVISNAVISDVTDQGYTVTCTVTDNWGVHSVAFPTWTLENGQDDLAEGFMDTQRGVKDGDTYTFRVKASDHNNEKGAYVTHIYAKDSAGNISSLSLEAVNVEEPLAWLERACFDPSIYRARNKDLEKLTDEQLKNHWYTMGIGEGRTASVILDLVYYQENNPDLKARYGDDYVALYQHFITEGYRQYRKSSPAFDGQYYVDANPDVSKDDYLRHYVEKGMAEGRKANAGFDVEYYRFLKPEVAQAHPDDYGLCVMHYIAYGVPEGVIAYDGVKPVISNAVISDITANGYTVQCTVTDNWGVERVVFPTWTLLGDQDDLDADFLTTQLGTKEGNTYTFHVKTSDHNDEIGMYVTHIYALDKGGNWVNLHLEPVEVKEAITLTEDATCGLEDDLLVNVRVGTKVSALLRQLENENLTVQDQSGNPLSNTAVLSTGVTMNLYRDGKLLDRVTVVVTGDVNGDGVVDTTDYMRVKALFLGRLQLSAAETRAADVDGSQSVDTTDYMKIKAYMLVKIDLCS